MLKKIAYVAFFVFMASGCAQSEDHKEGVEYKRITDQPTESTDKVEVLEFFWYGCPHCYKFEPILSNWLKTKPSNVEFIRVPTVFRPEWKVHARAYYALKAMGLGEKYHIALFDVLHKEKKSVYTEDQVTDFLVSQGVNEEDFKSAYAAFSVDGQVRKVLKKVKAYGLEGVPAMAVNGKYLVSAKEAGSYGNMRKIVDYLVKKEEAAK